MEQYNFDLNLDFLESPSDNKNITSITDYQTPQLQSSFEIESLANRIASVNDLVLQLKTQKNEVKKLQKQMQELSDSALSIQNLYEHEKAEKSNYLELSEKYKEKFEAAESQLANKTLHFEQETSRIAEEIERGPITYSELALKYQRLAVFLDSENILGSKEKCLLQNLSQYLESKNLKPLKKLKMVLKKPPDIEAAYETDSKIQRLPGVINEEPKDVCTQGTQYTWYTTTRGTNTPALNCPKKETRTQGTQYISSTTTRGTSTSTFIKTQTIGTNFPETLPVSVDDIFKEMIFDVAPLSPIVTELTDEVSYSPEKVEMKSVGTNTGLKNVRKPIDYVVQTIKDSDSRPSSRNMFERVKNESPFMSMPNVNPFSNIGMAPPSIQASTSDLWSVLGQTIFTLMQNGNASINPMPLNIINDRLRNPVSDFSRPRELNERRNFYEEEFQNNLRNFSPVTTRTTATSPISPTDLSNTMNFKCNKTREHFSTSVEESSNALPNNMCPESPPTNKRSRSKKISPADEILQLFPEYSDSIKKRNAVRRLLKLADKKSKEKKHNQVNNFFPVEVPVFGTFQNHPDSSQMLGQPNWSTVSSNDEFTSSSSSYDSSNLTYVSTNTPEERLPVIVPKNETGSILNGSLQTDDIFSKPIIPLNRSKPFVVSNSLHLAQSTERVQGQKEASPPPFNTLDQNSKRKRKTIKSDEMEISKTLKIDERTSFLNPETSSNILPQSENVFVDVNTEAELHISLVSDIKSEELPSAKVVQKATRGRPKGALTKNRKSLQQKIMQLKKVSNTPISNLTISKPSNSQYDNDSPSGNSLPQSENCDKWLPKEENPQNFILSDENILNVGKIEVQQEPLRELENQSDLESSIDYNARVQKQEATNVIKIKNEKQTKPQITILHEERLSQSHDFGSLKLENPQQIISNLNQFKAPVKQFVNNLKTENCSYIELPKPMFSTLQDSHSYHELQEKPILIEVPPDPGVQMETNKIQCLGLLSQREPDEYSHLDETTMLVPMDKLSVDQKLISLKEEISEKQNIVVSEKTTLESDKEVNIHSHDKLYSPKLEADPSFKPTPTVLKREDFFPLSSDSEDELTIDLNPSPEPTNSSYLNLSSILKSPEKTMTQIEFKTPDSSCKINTSLSALKNSTQNLVEDYLLNESPEREGPKFQKFLDRILDEVGPPLSPISVLETSEIRSEDEISCEEEEEEITSISTNKRKRISTSFLPVKRSARLKAKTVPKATPQCNLSILSIPNFQLGKYTKKTENNRKTNKIEVEKDDDEDEEMNIPIGFFKEMMKEDKESEHQKTIKFNCVQGTEQKKEELEQKVFDGGMKVSHQLPENDYQKLPVLNQIRTKPKRLSISVYFNDCPASPPPVDQNPNESHVIREYVEPEVDPIPSTNQSMVSQMISNYNLEYYKMLRKTLTTDEQILSHLKKVINYFLDGQCLIMDMLDDILKLTNHEETIAKAIVSTVKTLPRPITEVNPVPDLYLTKKMQTIISIIDFMQQKLPTLKISLQNVTENTIFTFKNDNLNVDVLMNLTQFYLAMIADGSKSTNPARLFICKCLYYYIDMATPMIYETLCVYPSVLPIRDDPTYDRSDALINTIQCILMSTYYDPEKSGWMMTKEIIAKLFKFYKYESFKPKRDEVIENLIAKIRAGRLKNVSYAFTLICKRITQQNTEKTILKGMLIPLANEYYQTLGQTTENDEKIVCVLECISFLIKPFSLDTNISMYLNLFIRFLNTSQRQIVQEAALAAILRTARFGFVQCFNAIHSFQPSYELSDSIKAMVRSFIYKKTQKFLRRLEEQSKILSRT